jgi:cardiolipin synthase C
MTRPMACLALLLAALLSGCAALPAREPLAPSHAQRDVAHTELARTAAASLAQDTPQLSGVRLLPGAQEALAARLALLRRAQQTIDAQYYLVADDATGRQFLRELQQAAARGVRVRLLVDDLHAAPQALAALAAQRGAEVRLFNPLPLRGGSVAARVLLSLHQFDRVNRRMHNKLLIADNSFAVSGGRNIADEYFMRAEVANFIDLDVLSSGPVVSGLSDVFDRFWNSELVVPLASLEPGALSEPVHALPSAPQGGAPAALPDLLDAQFEAGRIELHAAAVEVYADSPAKALGGVAANVGATALDSSLQMMQSASHEVAIASPYFIPGARGLKLMRDAVDRGIRVSVLTNSLAATDEPLAYWGYSRYRRDMLELGVALTELGPAQPRPAESDGPFRSSLGRLHAKVAVVDRQRLLVGSMNMDGRSSRSNTELGLAIHSAELASQAARTIQGAWSRGAYRLSMADANETVQWTADEGERRQVHVSEPHVGWFTRLRLGLVSWFVAEDLL